MNLWCSNIVFARLLISAAVQAVILRCSFIRVSIRWNAGMNVPVYPCFQYTLHIYGEVCRLFSRSRRWNNWLHMRITNQIPPLLEIVAKFVNRKSMIIYILKLRFLWRFYTHILLPMSYCLAKPLDYFARSLSPILYWDRIGTVYIHIDSRSFCTYNFFTLI